jgi:HTH-type transcriptional repressor of NAD biosynthesis genes
MSIGFYEGKFLPLHNGHIDCIKKAATQVDKLFVILGYNKKRDAATCKADECKYISHELRLAWLGNACKDLTNVTVLPIEDYDDVYDFKKMIGKHRGLMNAPVIDKIFTAEADFYGVDFKELYPEAEHVVFERTIPCSGTAIRKDPFANWDYIPKIVKSFFCKKVLITGVESTGKSTMVKKLAEHFCGAAVDEVGRDYCVKYGNFLTEQMFAHIGMEHYLKQLEAFESGCKWVFIDTDAVVTNYYKLIYCGGSFDNICEDIAFLHQEYDYIFYLEPTVPWVDDGLRFLPDQQTQHHSLLHLYQNHRMENRMILIRGTDYQERFDEILMHLEYHFA